MTRALEKRGCFARSIGTDRTPWQCGAMVMSPDSLRSTVRVNRIYGRAKRMTVDGAGGLWLTDFARHRLVRYDPRMGGRAVVRMRAAGGTVRHIAVDEQGQRVWLPMSDAGRIGLIRYRR